MTTKVKFVDFLPPDRPNKTSIPEPQIEEQGVQFKAPPPRGVRKSKKKVTLPRRTCTSKFDNGVSIVQCVLAPGHYEFHQAESLNDGWWPDVKQIKGTG